MSSFQVTKTLSDEPRDTPIPLPPQAMPLLVTFDDITDPTTVRLVDPTNLSASFGPGVSLAGVTLEITGADVMDGRVEAVLGWLNDPRYMNNPGWAALPVLTKDVILGLKHPYERLAQ